MNKRVRKSVTFDKSTASAHAHPTLPRSLFPASFSKVSVVPIHLPALLYFMFRQGLTEHVCSSLVTGLCILFPLQAIYNAHLSSVMSTGSAFVTVTSSIFLSLVLSVPMFAVFILAGAPMASHLSHTFLMTLHLAVATLSPLLVYFAFDTTAPFAAAAAPHAYRRILSSTVLASSLGGLLGTWLGVLPIPLDWDRPWQQWPITLLSGGYIFSCIGGALSLMITPPRDE